MTTSTTTRHLLHDSDVAAPDARPVPRAGRRKLWEDVLFPPILDRLLGTEEASDARRRAVAGLSGDIVEIGFGTGMNLAHLPEAVTSVRVVEPSPGSLRRARRRIEASGVPVAHHGLDGQRLPFADDSVDHVLLTWSFCTIPDPVAAAREIRRVLCPGGTLHFVEHALSPDPDVARLQRRLDPLWTRFACGCHLDRDPVAVLTEAGLAPQHVEAFEVPGAARFAAWAVEGRATKEVDR